MCCLAHCQRQLTDGFVPTEVLPLIGASTWKRDIEKLVAVSLLHQVEGGYQVHDYLKHNASRADVLAKRSQDSARKGYGFRPDSDRIPSGGQPDSEASRARPIPSHPIPTNSTPTEERKTHRRCAVGPCGRVCLHETKFAEFVLKRGGPRDEAERYVSAWKLRIDEAWDADNGANGRIEISGKPWDFWDARWAEDHQAAEPTPAELRDARQIRDKAWGGCRHEPRCANSEACVMAIVQLQREKRRAS